MNKSRRRGRVSNNQFTTRSGNTIKIHRSLTDRIKNRKESRSLSKAERMAGMPKGRVQRFFYRLQPKRLYHYWFSREGGVMALKITGIAIIAGFLLLVGMFAYFRKDLPDLRDISGNNIGGSIQYYDRTGKTLLWEDYDAVKRIPVQDEEINDYIKNATIAVEDKDFFKHGGFDVRGILRAGVNNAVGSGGTQGGSTITQQLVKLSQNWTQERTVTRKIKEVILAVELERSYSKQEILVGYLNTAPYGGVEYGVEAAARGYFDKSAKKLTLDEAAMLAAIPKSPSYYSPRSNDFDKEAFVGRQHYILDLMTEQGMITPEQRDKAKKVNTLKKVKKRKPKYDGIKAPYFVLTAKEQLEDKYGAETVKRGGWKVTTTLDMEKQDIAEDEVTKGMGLVRAQGGDTAAFVSEDVKTGQVVALVGGPDFRNKEFGENNYARLRIPPGSSFKPYDYTSLIEHTDTTGAGSVLYDTQGALPGYDCTNKARPKNGGNCLHDYDFRYPGPVTLRYALGASRNVPAVKAMLIAGVDKTIQTAEKLGLKSGYKCYANEQFTKEAQCGGSSAIGDGAILVCDMTKTKTHKVANQYDNDNYNYLHYWQGRDYEHAAEEMALTRLLKGKHFRHAADIGGGYGRLCIFLKKYADKVTLAEPSKAQLDIAKDYLKDYPDIDQKLMQADDLKFSEGELDLITMIRVMHHLPDPKEEFKQLSRVLAEDGMLILEVANYAHGLNRLKHMAQFKKLPVDPVDIRSEENRREEEIAFVNHNPKTVIKQLAHAGLKVEKVLSVSNLRSPALKKVVPKSMMLSVEKFLQPTLARTYFGPSVFFVVRKAK